MDSFLKRAFDVLFSALFLTLATPLLAAIALAVKCSSPGPIIYRCTRMGKERKIISCLKFRTMYENADKKLAELLRDDEKKQEEWALYQKLKADPRITPVGQFLRRTSLDEALQFWNVLKGDLSVVGPRPLAINGNPSNYLQQVESIYGDHTSLILSVKPGITGIWQVSGRSHIPLAERRKMEANYILKRTFFTDFILIVKTIPAVVFSRGAF